MRCVRRRFTRWTHHIRSNVVQDAVGPVTLLLMLIINLAGAVPLLLIELPRTTQSVTSILGRDHDAESSMWGGGRSILHLSVVLRVL